MSNVFKDTVCLSVTFHMPGDTRPGNMAGIQTQADQSELRLRKHIFRSDSYKECWRIARKTRQWLERRSVPSPLKSGTYLVPRTLLPEVEEMLGVSQAAFNAEADSFIAEYPWLIERAKERLADQFDQRNYVPAEVFRRRFWMERMFIDFAPAGGVDQQEELKQAIEEIKTALRCGLLELVQKLAGMLGERADGKKRSLSSNALAAFTEWMDLLPARLVVDDDELKALADKAKAVMSGKSADDLRDVGTVRSQVKQELDGVACQLQALVKDMPSRAFGFDE